MTQAPAFIQGKAAVLAASLKAFDSTGDYHAFAVAVLVTFPAFGFLFGYLSTRLYLASAFARADLAAINSTKTTIEATSGSVESLSQRVSVLTAQFNQITSGHQPSMPSTSAAVTGSLEKEAVISPAQAIPPPPPPAPKPKERSFIKAIDQPDIEVAPVKTLDQNADVKSAMRDLSFKYLNVTSSSQSERVQARNLLADQLAVSIRANRLLRDWVVTTVLTEQSDGLVAGLATAINAEPEKEDVNRIIRIAPFAQIKHSRYRVATTIGRLFETKIATANDIVPMLAILSNYFNHNSDSSLQRRIQQTLAQITQSTGLSVSL